MADAAQPEPYVFHRDVLDNGLTVFTLEDHRTPIASVQVWYHVGSKDEDPERQGFAHMFEHMMFRGTDKIGPQDHFKYLQRYGAQVNGYTTFDTTVYYEVLPATQLDLAMWLEAERMGNLKIIEDYFVAEREVVKEERRMRYLNRPYGRLYETLFDAAFTKHPYRWTPIGNIPHLNAAKVEELAAFWEKYYVPNNATLVVSGDVTHADVMEKARRYFGGIKQGETPPRVTITEPPITEPRRVELKDIAPSPRVVFAYHAPSARDSDSLALDVLSRILSGGQSSPLYRRLVQGKELAVNVFAANYSLEQSGLFMMSATLKPGVTIEQTEAALLEELKRMLDEGISKSDLEKAKNQELASFVRGSETVDGRASRLGYAAVVMGDPNRVNTDLTYMQSLTAEDILAVGRKVFGDPDNRVTIVIEPDENAKSDEAAGAAQSGGEELHDKPEPPDLPKGAPPKPVDLPFAQLRKLPNGLRVAVFTDHTVPAVRIAYRALAGGKNDPVDQPGVADVMVSTLRRGTSKHTGDELAEVIDYHGMSLGESVDHEDLGVSMWTLSEHLDLAMATLTEIVREPTFPESEVANYVGRAAAQAAIHEQDPSVIASRKFNELIYGDHYLARPVSGTSASLKTIDRAAVAEHYAKSLAPNVSTLLFSGDIAANDAFALAEKHFGDWSHDAVASGKGVQPPANQGLRIVLVDRPGAVQSEIRIGQLVSLDREDPNYAAVRLAGQAFGGAFSSRLNRSLRIAKGLTYGARGYFDVAAKEASFLVSTFTRTEKTVEAVKAALKEIDGMIEPTYTEEELELARNSILGGFQMALETSSQVADRFWSLTVWGLPETWYTDYLHDIAGVNKTTYLSKAAADVIRPGELTLVVVGDGDKIAEDLAAIAPVERVRE